MTRRENLIAQEGVIRQQIVILEEKKEKEFIKVLAPYFKFLPEEVIVDVRGEAVYFKKAHPDSTYNKEMFTLYLRSSYSEEREYNGIDISYYTTSTKLSDKWEIERLVLLGGVASIMSEKEREIVDKLNDIADSNREEVKVCYAQLRPIRQELEDIKKEMKLEERRRVLEALLNEGVGFKEGAYIGLKFNYTVRVKSIKLIDVSASGKTATAVFEYLHHGSVSREEKVNVEKVTGQVLSYAKDIVSTLELV